MKNQVHPAICRSAVKATTPSEFALLHQKRGEGVIIVTIKKAQGSTPRDADTQMLVSTDAFFGTIGGGRLEWIALEQARAMLAANQARFERTVPLGPELGQCCGGSVDLVFERLTPEKTSGLFDRSGSDQVPKVYIHGAGHTGKAIARALSLLPFDLTLIDTREDELADLKDLVAVRHSVLPEDMVRSAAPGTAFIILTHEHHLDFLLAAETLARGDAAYVGMIGSKSKRAVLKNWLVENGYEEGLMEMLTCPIGASAFKDKRPEVIAAKVAAELLEVFAARKMGQESSEPVNHPR